MASKKKTTPQIKRIDYARKVLNELLQEWGQLNDGSPPRFGSAEELQSSLCVSGLNCLARSMSHDSQWTDLFPLVAKLGSRTYIVDVKSEGDGTRMILRGCRVL
jgi:hypothetical protein